MDDSSLLELFNSSFVYLDGELYWKQYNSRISIGSKAGTVNSHGYKVIKLQGRVYKAHRIIYLMFHSCLPKYIDHVDGNKQNNIIGNLRPCNKSENGLNAKVRANNKSKIKGVSWDKSTGKWRVAMAINNKYKTVGRYQDIELAELVAIEAREKFHGQFCRHY